jgi:hypothetical protein
MCQKALPNSYTNTAQEIFIQIRFVGSNTTFHGKIRETKRFTSKLGMKKCIVKEHATKFSVYF